EGSVAAGVRRVEAVVGQDALTYIERQLAELEGVRAHFRTLQRPLGEEVASLIEQNRQLQKQIDALQQQSLESQLDGFIREARQVGPVRLVTGRLASTSMDALHTLGQRLRDRLGNCSVGVLGTVDPDGGKVYLVAAVSDDLISGHGLKAG